MTLPRDPVAGERSAGLFGPHRPTSPSSTHPASSTRRVDGIPAFARLAVALAGLGALAGCSLYRDPEPTSAERPPTSQSWERLEESWGPGEFAALFTGTVSSKDRNFWLNIPFASWYVREQDRKGVGILGGALAYDMVSVERRQGRAESKKLRSIGFLGLAGRLEDRKLDGSREYAKHQWLFPFYRYKNVNGQRTVYPFFIFPVALKDDPPQVGYDPQALAAQTGDPLDPPDVRERRPTVAASELLDPPPYEPSPFGAGTALEGTPYESAPVALDPDDSWDPEPVSTTPERAPLRRAGNRGAGRWTPTEAVPRPVSDSPPAARSYTVRPGDSLFRIARSVYGKNSAWKKIFAANQDKLTSPDRLREGMVLKLP